ncbi:enoyl-CoA hydratase/isomerase family protein [Stenotrophomonas sp. CFBP 13718]|uniref:enoyl-CoA hydratase/isomerase family protein n=1 Tax=Stenotrophomonas sp. CFBP 13718 TaxID=2775304 RepID=UPI001780C213|nr:enoyl-CoA hydratase/isomerase family protein [Stenotrophomonas sp. CFBP 13718]MBD8697980.1 enoyl-CoA hydratase/isomerase family protein [Stenotrophomonas sp. CFBP 13718]
MSRETDIVVDEAPVLFEERTAANGTRIGIATLNAPRTLNGFSLPMAHLLLEKLRAWADDDGVAVVVLQGAGEKAFCAGGDLHSLYQSMQAYRAAGQVDIRQNTHAAEFFDIEYRVDYLIHAYPKPILCWGHGIVMGGGIGLMSGASHRVVSERSKLAFPEITVGLFPDVGGSWLLQRVPGKGGLFLALTGALLGPGDAIHADLADLHIAESQRAEVFDALLQADWGRDSEGNHGRLDTLLQAFASDAPAGPLQAHADLLETLCAGDELPAIIERIRALQTDDAWLQNAQKTLAAGAPGSARLAFELQRRTAGADLATVYRLEYVTALHCAAHGDFAEGIRALLVDKDRTPHWNPASLTDASAAWAEDFFISPWPADQHPLADLGATAAERTVA